MAWDKYHGHVRDALTRDGWIVADQHRVKYGRRTVFADLGASQLLAADQGTAQIAVEVKDFFKSATSYFELAVGQYLCYKSWMARAQPKRVLWLAISTTAAQRIFTELSAQVVVADYGIRLLVVDMEQREIVQWIP